MHQVKKILPVLGLLYCSSFVYGQNDSAEWISLFNGRNLENWVPKFTGHELGVNYRDTFKVEDGVIIVSYANWPDFNGEFGHLFYDSVFSHYRLRVEYRFVGEQVNNGPGWAYRNNGIMLHGQAPESMTLEQEFPASIEVQLLGGNGSDPRATANVCSPGTNYVMNGGLITQHCVNSSSATYHGDQWVTVEVEVRGDELLRHSVNGEVVFEYSATQLDERDPDAQRLIGQGQAIAVQEGTISIQAESHPTEFRKIELLRLAP
ncbi:MAG: DUF1080 domain-containing protein [Gammaproteobacteria bacterium]|jgi:hypothetical protein|nr:hypothetical protein [Gammaproteobacteria bacterium]MDP6097565.1 DUF1080 domain-containing protein [Gammaproteobacteria bacterium]MDP7455974.1 DUF1080 domain-containing protein [Gammaproteobacteria bacterium]